MTDAPTPAVPMLELVDVVKSYGQGETEVYALRDVTLTVAPGEIVAVMGPSGCGKSTLLHLAGALEMPSAGRVRVGGRELASMPVTPRRRCADVTSATCSSASTSSPRSPPSRT